MRTLDATPTRVKATSLVERYRPRNLDDLIGQGEAAYQLREFLEAPHSGAFVFSGPTGTGKTSAALALATELGAVEFGGLNTIRSGGHDAEAVETALDALRFTPMLGSGWKVIVVDEADYASEKARQLWLSALEDLPPRSVIVFTTNHPEKLSRRFLTRCEHVRFGAGPLLLSQDAQALIDRIWSAELGSDAPPAPRFADLPETIEDGHLSFRAVVIALAPLIRRARREFSEAPPVAPLPLSKTRTMSETHEPGQPFESFANSADFANREHSDVNEPLTLKIARSTYAVEVLDENTIRLEKTTGKNAVYDVEFQGTNATCSCPDYQYRRAGLDRLGCKHIQSLRVAGWIPDSIRTTEPERDVAPSPVEGWDTGMSLAEVDTLPPPEFFETPSPLDLAATLVPVCGGAPEERDLFDNRYHGPRWRYLLVYRPLNVACAPRDFILKSDRPHPDSPHGTIDYPRPLTDKELYDFQLRAVPIPEPTPPPIGGGAPKDGFDPKHSTSTHDAFSEYIGLEPAPICGGSPEASPTPLLIGKPEQPPAGWPVVPVKYERGNWSYQWPNLPGNPLGMWSTAPPWSGSTLMTPEGPDAALTPQDRVVETPDTSDKPTTKEPPGRRRTGPAAGSTSWPRCLRSPVCGATRDSTSPSPTSISARPCSLSGLATRTGSRPRRRPRRCRSPTPWARSWPAGCLGPDLPSAGSS